MSEKEKPFDSQDPSLLAGNKDTFREVDLRSPEVLEMLKERGELMRRRIEPIKGVREPESEEQVDTIVNGIVESSKVARPGEDKIITGSKGEEFVLSNEKYTDLYTTDENGTVTPRERRVMAMQNPYGEPIRIEAPWSTPEDPQTQDGTAEAILTFGLDEAGHLTADRYIIGDHEMLLNNYEPVVVPQAPEAINQ